MTIVVDLSIPGGSVAGGGRRPQLFPHLHEDLAQPVPAAAVAVSPVAVFLGVFLDRAIPCAEQGRPRLGVLGEPGEDRLSYDNLCEELIPAALQEYEENRNVFGRDDFRDLANGVRLFAGLTALP